MTGEGAGNATFMLDMTEHGEVEDFVPGDGTDGNATFVWLKKLYNIACSVWLVLDMKYKVV